MTLKIALVQVSDIDRLYEVFYQSSGLSSFRDDRQLKEKFVETFKSTKKPLNSPYPLGILTLSAYARKIFKNKIEFYIIDMLQKRYSSDDVMQVLDKICPDIVGLSTFSAFSKTLHTLASSIKARDSRCKVIAGGAYCSASAMRAASDPNIDCIVYGEGEETFVEILQRTLVNKPLVGISQTAHLSGKGVVINRPRPLIQDIDSLPYPAVDLIDLPGYWGHISPLGKAGPWMILFNSRGCPYHCIYCHCIFGKKARFMSPKRTVNEINFYHKQYNISEFHVWDDIFNLNVNRGIELSRLISGKKKDWRFLFLGGLRADIMQKHLLDCMIKAGCCYICYAIESASPRIQKLIQKNLKLDKAAKAINFTADEGVWVNTYNMLGFPTETKEEMEHTINYNRSLKHHSVRLFKVIPQEGTGLYEMVVSKRKTGNAETGFYMDYDQLYSGDVSKEEFDELISDGLMKFYLDEGRIRRITEMKSPTLSENEIKRMYVVEILNTLMRCGIKDISELSEAIQPLVRRLLAQVTLPPVK